MIPCCADLDELRRQDGRCGGARTDLERASGPIVMVYVGKFTGWYLEREMVDFFAAARKLVPDLLFVVLTQSDRAIIEREFARGGIGARTTADARGARRGRPLPGGRGSSDCRSCAPAPRRSRRRPPRSASTWRPGSR